MFSKIFGRRVLNSLNDPHLLVQEAVLHAALVARPRGVTLHVHALEVVAEREEEGQVVAGNHVGGDGLERDHLVKF